ncbi:uncharacterized protein LOC119176327 isoform X2 [Rhipicephalus microplus]|uniref:uncharacterized protein LOC119176327 isoform X2 n=1 Tax=Rhipicephalus microplus TaxID=6941 RepID=UPI003F6A87F9
MHFFICIFFCHLQGYTPLHLAYMFNQYHIAELLRTYGADANARDNSGRKPGQYQRGGVPQPVRATVVSGSKTTPQPSRSLEKDLGFMRMGSFNSRVKRTAAALTNPFGVQKLKPWGSADSVADGAAPCMAPPKSVVKKKKSKKVIDFPRFLTAETRELHESAHFMNRPWLKTLRLK